MTDVSYDKQRSLNALETQMANDEAGFGPLTKLDHTDDKSIGVYEDGRAPDEPIELVTGGGDAVPDGHVKVCSGTVWILGQLQEVTAVRKE